MQLIVGVSRGPPWDEIWNTVYDWVVWWVALWVEAVVRVSGSEGPCQALEPVLCEALATTIKVGGQMGKPGLC